MTVRKEDEAQHGITLCTTRKKGRAVCLCGWIGPLRNDPVFASSDGAGHIRNVSR
jgi:hypothetical protein